MHECDDTQSLTLCEEHKSRARTGCSEHLDLRGRKQQKAVENCTMRRFIICTHQQVLLYLSNQEHETGKACR